MPQELTHNPKNLQAGDIIWIMKTPETNIKLTHEKMPRMNSSYFMKPMPCKLLKITQTLKENNKEGTGGPRKRMFEYHIMPTCADAKTEIIYATHKDNIFHTLEDLNKWIQTQMRRWNKTKKKHEERYDQVKEILYINE